MPAIIQCPCCETKLKSNKTVLPRQATCPKCKTKFSLGRPESGSPIQNSTETSVPSPYIDGSDIPLDATHNLTEVPAKVAPSANDQLGRRIHIPNADIAKIEAIISDAKLLIVAIILCLFGIGCVIAGPWYFIRQKQWERFSVKYPFLLDPAAEIGSLAQRFQRSKTAISNGLLLGILIPGLYLFLVIQRIFA